MSSLSTIFQGSWYPVSEVTICQGERVLVGETTIINYPHNLTIKESPTIQARVLTKNKKNIMGSAYHADYVERKAEENERYLGSTGADSTLESLAKVEDAPLYEFILEETKGQLAASLSTLDGEIFRLEMEGYGTGEIASEMGLKDYQISRRKKKFKEKKDFFLISAKNC